MRYATSHNFTGVRLYPVDARCLVHQIDGARSRRRRRTAAQRGRRAGVLGLLPPPRRSGADVPDRAEPRLGGPAGTVCAQPRGRALCRRHRSRARPSRTRLPGRAARPAPLPARHGHRVRRLHAAGVRLRDRRRQRAGAGRTEPCCEGLCTRAASPSTTANGGTSTAPARSSADRNSTLRSTEPERAEHPVGVTPRAWAASPAHRAATPGSLRSAPRRTAGRPGRRSGTARR